MSIASITGSINNRGLGLRRRLGPLDGIEKVGVLERHVQLGNKVHQLDVVVIPCPPGDDDF
jgi:hypothetical protein